jgi:copper transport protein
MTRFRPSARRTVVLLGFACVAVVALAAPASAHAQLESTEPQAGGVYDDAPREITLRYSEPVEASLGAVRVYDGAGDRIDAGKASHPGGAADTVRVDLPALSDGSYVVTWRVLSADSHPVQGAFTFQVGPEATADNLESLTQRLLASQGGSESVGVVYAVARFGVFASLALLVGGVAFVVLVWRAGRDSQRARRLVWAGWIGALASTAVGFVLKGPYAAGLGLADAFDPELLGDVFDTRSGKVWVARALILLLALPLLRRLLPGHRPVAEYPLTAGWTLAAALVGAALVATPGLGGHASSGILVPLAVVADAAHLGAVSIWLGGLAVLFVAFLPRAGADELRATLPRYSQVALAAIVVIVITGTFQSWRQVGSFGALRDTDFGRLLVIKLLLFAVIIVAAAFSREVVNRTFRARTARVREPVVAGGPVPPSGGATDYDVEFEPLDDATEVQNLRRSVMVEVALAVVVLVVTALLVNAPPARSEAAEPYAKVLKTDDLWFDVRVDPAAAGENNVHMTALTTTGGPTDVLEMEVSLTQPERDIAPIDVPLRRLGPGHYVAYDVNIPIPGDWELIANALIDDTTQVVAKDEVEIR